MSVPFQNNSNYFNDVITHLTLQNYNPSFNANTMNQFNDPGMSMGGQ